MPLPSAAVEMVLRSTGARAVTAIEVVQQLWSGYGQIVRCHLDDGNRQSVIVKHVRWPDEIDHPRGWSTDRSHERKVRSYQVETAWYADVAELCPADRCRVPACLAVETDGDEVLLILEDLDDAGFAGRSTRATLDEIDAGLAWLAGFHATFLGVSPVGLWPIGTYWHLDTRPDELAAMPDGPLKRAATAIDRRLTASPFQTLVHGDAKLANFCFSADGRRAAAVDFQYVGGGCGMKDVTYFIGSCLDEAACQRRAPALLDRYFVLLADALAETGSPVDRVALEADWRSLYAVAWTDFSRFLQGWSPGHGKLHAYSARLEREVLASPGLTRPAPTAVDLGSLADLAVDAARAAGRIIAASRPARIDHKAGAASAASQVVTEVDHRSEAVILDHLAPTLDRFDLGLLTEERDDDGGRRSASHFWCIDPLDGTLSFVEDRPGYAVSIALVRHDGTPVIGVVHDPLDGATFRAIDGSGVSLDGVPWAPPPAGSKLTVFADRSFVEHPGHAGVRAALDTVATDLGLDGVDVRVGAGAVMNAIGALRTPNGCYLKFPAAAGGGSLWDFAATACLFSELGAVATDVHGEPLDLNRVGSTFMNHRGVLFASDAELAERLRKVRPPVG